MANPGGGGLGTGVKPWWMYPRIDNYGAYPDPQGFYPKPDSNIKVPDNYPLAALLPGVVTAINGSQQFNDSNHIEAYGATIAVKLNQPINNGFVTHYAMLHLASIAPGIVVGTPVNTGDIIAYAGGNAAQGSAKALTGFALMPSNNKGYAYGGWWTQYIDTPNHVADPRLDPTPLLNAAASGDPSFIQQTYNSTPTPVPGIRPAMEAVGSTLHLAPDANVAAFLQALNESMVYINPFVPLNDDPITILGATFENPFTYIGDVFNGFGQDIGAFTLRIFFLLSGFYLCFKVMNKIVDFSAIIGKVEKGAEIAASVAAL